MSAIINRILKQLGNGNLLCELLSLSKSDLNSLLLELFHLRVQDISPSELLKAYKQNRFSAPSETNPIKYHEFEVDLLSIAQAMDIKPLLLSPSAPIGSCSAFGCVAQNNIISAVRGTETLSDPSNMLAIIIADKIKGNQIDNNNSQHFCTTARIVRAQAFSGKDFYAHFGLFCMVSTGNRRDSYACEVNLLKKHLAYYKKLFLNTFKIKFFIVLRKRNGYADNECFFARMSDFLQSELPDIHVSYDYSDCDNSYYKGVNFKLYTDINGEAIEIGDGGFVDWIQKMIGSKKERCLISAISIDRLIYKLQGNEE